MTTSPEVLDKLNELLEVNNDRIDGYETAAKEAKDEDLKLLFHTFANHSIGFRHELSNLVLSCGGIPQEGSSTSGKVYRAWMNIKAAITGNDRNAIINSCEYGEDVAVETYKSILDGDHIDSQIRWILMKEQAVIISDHDRIKSLKDTQ
jgi:uncharacterized protein (TIGR02284 family)